MLAQRLAVNQGGTRCSAPPRLRAAFRDIFLGSARKLETEHAMY
jgi:hypothetical protein